MQYTTAEMAVHHLEILILLLTTKHQEVHALTINIVPLFQQFISISTLIQMMMMTEDPQNRKKSLKLIGGILA